MTIPRSIAQRYPYTARILATNPYHLPIGKVFLCARVREGDASPFAVEIYSHAGDYRLYQFRRDEVELTPREVAP